MVQIETYHNYLEQSKNSTFQLALKEVFETFKGLIS